MDYDKLFAEYRNTCIANTGMAALLEEQGKALVANRELVRLLARILQANDLEVPDEALPFLR